MSEAKTTGGAPPGPRKPLPRWKKVLLVLAVALFVCGAGLKVYGYVRGPRSDKTVSSNPRAGGNSLVEGTGGASLVGTTAGGRGPNGDIEGGDVGDDGAEGQTTSDMLSPAFMKGGLGFFLGFCMGYALRTFFKVSAFFIGVGLLGYFGLTYFHIVPPPDWAAIQDRFAALAESFKGQASAFQAFITSNLSSAGLGTAGLVTGFKKN